MEFLVCFFLFFAAIPARSQSVPDTAALDISKVQTMETIDRSMFFAVYKKGAVADTAISGLDFSQKIPVLYNQRLPLPTAGKSIYLKFSLYNGADSTVQVYFFPGIYCKRLDLFKAARPNPGKLELLTEINRTGFALITLKPREHALFYARLNFVLTTANSLWPRIIKKDFLAYFKVNLLSNKTTVNLFNYLTAGILLMMIFYSLAVYLQSYHIEFIYYSVYAFCMALLLFLKSFLFGSTTSFNYFFEGYFDFIVQMTGYYFYLLFFRKFLNTRQEHPFLERVFVTTTWVIIVSIILFTLFYFLSGDFGVVNLIENTTKQLLLLASLIFILYSLGKKDPLMNYLLTGQLFLTFFSIVSFLLLTTAIRVSDTPGSMLNDSLIYYQVGLVLELLFFMAGLSYKNKRDLVERIKERERLKLDNERKEFEKQVAILEAKQQERNRISADMHDELGSGVTAIRLMSEIVKTKMKENTLPEIEKISHSANELLNKMNTIIWTMVSSNDTVESLVAYIRAYTVEFFENTAIECHFSLPSSINPSDLSGEKRRNIFLSVKEALNNVLKHSHASRVTITITVDQRLMIEIADNGVGIDMENIRKFGNGLQNMKKRIGSIAGEFRIENRQGTRTVFELDL